MGFQMMLMTMRSIVMMKIMEIRMMISYIMYSLNSNALLFTTNILRVDAHHALGVIAMKKNSYLFCVGLFYAHGLYPMSSTWREYCIPHLSINAYQASPYDPHSCTESCGWSTIRPSEQLPS